jgi:hypothetical protein
MKERDGPIYFVVKDGQKKPLFFQDIVRNWKLIALHLCKKFNKNIFVCDQNEVVFEYVKPKRGSGHKRIGGKRGPDVCGGKFEDKVELGKGEDEVRKANTQTAYFINVLYKGIKGSKKRFTVGSVYYILKQMGCLIGDTKTSFVRHFKERYLNNKKLNQEYKEWLHKS